MKPNAAIFLCSVFAAIHTAYSQGILIKNGIRTEPINQIHVDQSPATGDYTGCFLAHIGGGAFSFSSFVDEGVRVFIVSPGDLISLQPIVDLKYPELTSANLTFDQTIPVYLGFYTGRDPWIIENGTSIYTGIYKDPVFGWGEFVSIDGAIVMLDSALEYGGGGIIAGTQTILPVPEPGTLAMTALGGVVLFWRFRSANK